MRLLRLSLAPVLMIAVAVPGLASADDPASEERLAVRFAHVPDGLVQHGRYLGEDIVAIDRGLGFVVVASDDPQAFRGRAVLQEGVISVEADPIQPLASFVPDDALYSTQYGPQLIGAPAAWDLAASLAAPTICIVDSGIRATHADLAAKVAAGIDLVNGDSDPADDNGHGTHVAGIAAARTNNSLGIAGISPGPLMIAKVLDASGSGALSTVASGIRWCVDGGAKVVSLSLGSTSGSSTLQSAVDYAWSHGALTLAAAGNGNSCTACVQYPARYTNAIAVGCVDQSRAPCTFASTGPEIDLAAPGNAIQSTWSNSDTAYMRAGGTSMSTPHVAGAAALVWATHPEWSNAQVRAALEGSAQDVAAAGKDVQAGAGLVRADLAIAFAAAADPLVPPAPAPGVGVSPPSQAKSIAVRGTAVYAFTVQNTGSANDTIALSLSAVKGGWSASLSAPSLTLAPNATAAVQLTVTAPAKAGSLSLTLTAMSGLDPAAKAIATAKTMASK
jgi:thermitase